MSDIKSKYRRDVEELREVASMFWPRELSEKAAEVSVIPKLLETQDQFISMLSIELPSLDSLYQITQIAELPGNLFLKHLVVLADFGGEKLQRMNSEFDSIFPSREFRYYRDGKLQTYVFEELPISGRLTNNKLGISGKKLLEVQPLTPLLRDVITLLIFGSASEDEHTARVLENCEVGNYLGQPEKLQKFVKQRYIWVSRITGGATANTLGHAAQDFVLEYLEEHLDSPGLEISPDGNLPGVTHTQDDRLTNFDIVVNDGEKYAAIEVSFQVTTNSTIERKAGQARSRFQQIDDAGYKIAYVIDGAGNFERENAIRTLCLHSHCSVAFSRKELDRLCRFLEEYFEGKQ